MTINQLRVAIFMGSESDLPVMSKAAETLRQFGIGHRMAVASAHRSPNFLAQLIAEAREKGVQVFIAGAGGAAHLAGAIAAQTTQPVIGVPISSKLQGLDSLLSTVQMPSGVPVATVAVDGAANAALLAVQMLALSDTALARKLSEHKEGMACEVIRKSQKTLGEELKKA